MGAAGRSDPRPACAAGDRLTVIDPDGGQPAELLVLGRRPRGARASGRTRRRRVLAERGLVPDDARAIRLFGPDGPPGRARGASRRAATRPCSSPRPAGASSTATGRRRRSWSSCSARSRAARERGRAAARRWPSRGSTSASTRPPRSSYEVREGEYIQIIDVAGRQCSDFLAFHAHKLDKGIERGLDPQVTRTLMGTAYPTVGLHSKYYDADMDPLCQVVQDTVGRHDSFALACTRPLLRGPRLPRPRQLHGELQPPARRRYGIAPKKGWAALNFFYNTLVRPGPRAAVRRAVVAAGRLRPAARDVRPRLRLVGLPGRHRPRQRLGGHRRPRPRLLTGEPLLDGHRAPRHPGGRARADQGDRRSTSAGRR